MRLHVMSDLHLEFHRDGGSEFVDSLPVPEVDALVLAGDIGNIRALYHLTDVLTRICSKYRKTFFVFGNHEFYGASLAGIAAAKPMLEANVPNLKVLTDQSVQFEDRRILGGTMWFPFRPDDILYRHLLADFGHIRDWQAIEDHHTSFMEMAKDVREGDIVISHHVPSRHSVHEAFRGSDLNRFFVTDLTELIEERKPALWIHGHTHFCFDYVLGSTRIVCKPFGYPTEATGFREGLVVEI